MTTFFPKIPKERKKKVWLALDLALGCRDVASSWEGSVINKLCDYPHRANSIRSAT